MFTGNGGFALKIFFFNIIIGHFRCKVFCRNRKRRQKIGQRAIVFYPKPFFHFLRCITAKQRTISF